MLEIPSFLFAEVSDKMPTVPNTFLMAFGGGVVAFVLARLHPRLVAIGAGLAMSITLSVFGSWKEAHIREAVIHEQGLAYFILQLLAAGIPIGLAVAGAKLYQQRNAVKAK